MHCIHILHVCMCDLALAAQLICLKHSSVTWLLIFFEMRLPWVSCVMLHYSWSLGV